MQHNYTEASQILSWLTSLKTDRQRAEFLRRRIVEYFVQESTPTQLEAWAKLHLRALLSKYKNNELCEFIINHPTLPDCLMNDLVDDPLLFCLGDNDE